MAITISSLGTPTNVAASLQTGGSLSASTTYYCVVTAQSADKIGYDNRAGELSSDVSAEVSFTTDATNKSATITWDAVTGATNYNVYITTISGDYIHGSQLEVMQRRCNGTSNTTTNTNSYTITALSTGTVYSVDTILNKYEYSNESTFVTTLPFNIDKDRGTIYVELSGSDTETLETITSALDTGGYSDYYYYDGTNFALKGSIGVASGATGRLILLNKSLYFIKGALQNNVSTFEMRLGYRYNDVNYQPCIYRPTLLDNRMHNIKMYGGTLNGSNFQTGYLHRANTIGIQIVGMHADIKDVDFYWVRNTNTDWSNNTLNFPIMSRAWNVVTITNSNYRLLSALTYYPTNNVNTFYSTTFDIRASTHAMEANGHTSNTTPTPTCTHYDSKFIGDYYSSLRDLIFRFSNYIYGLTGFEFYNTFKTVITDEDGNALSGVSVKGYNTSDTLVYEETTDSNGETSDYVLSMKIVPTGNGTGSSFYTRTFPSSPLKIIFSKSGYETQTHYVSVEEPFSTVSLTMPSIKKIRQTIEGKLLLANKPELGSRAKLLEI